MELLPADASKTTLGTPTLHVDLSALSMRTAPLTRHAQDYFGDPYVACRPECTINADCPSN